ncbi:hypothetical protein [Sphaerisporangium sp. TRM90804]|uniref:hypothetical protein n=1 Tax=Sphaerisporangium sp. TRM90804 TaxID=3031113 RepID=UPI00244C9635|nr:hypothetical protein [Sphaerisporangium sp. TRM90804]MDH2426460.1 hypothetical protein [Sphaerisporangium sp. TRM90804]
MGRVTPEDWEDIRKLARGYCRTVDATRSRKRMDGSATVVKEGHAPYGTDDVSDDVNQDAVLMFAQRLRDITAKCRPGPESGTTRETQAWVYVRRDGGEMVITRATLQRWAVRDAAARNGYRVDVPPAEIDATPGAQVMRGLPHAESITRVAVGFYVAQHSTEIFRSAWGDGREFPVLREALTRAVEADDLGRAGILSAVAQSLHGGAYGSRRNVIRARDAAKAEWQELSARLDDTRDAMVYRGGRKRERVTQFSTKGPGIPGAFRVAWSGQKSCDSGRLAPCCSRIYVRARNVATRAARNRAHREARKPRDSSSGA